MRGRQTVRDMVLSLAAIGAFAAVIYLVLPHDDTEKPPQKVDYQVELTTARRAAGYPVAAPEGLGKGWAATSVRFDGAAFKAWHLGFHGPDRTYVAVEQSTERPSRFIDRVTRGADETKLTQEIGGDRWRRYDGSDYDALVLKEKGVTTVVTGPASRSELTHVAERLKRS
ncbi:DUF4245 domain-containing protein [Streptomyces physcomitrii]|uniref:DUF4245 domain-containing protein n=1 Tax=Streptomyces physcomitrii TaxID=2724184 RepID=UPI0033CE730A